MRKFVGLTAGLSLVVGVGLLVGCQTGGGQNVEVSGAEKATPPELLRSVLNQTYVYKTVDGLQIKAEVHRFADDETRPVVIYIHGGALINGNRDAGQSFTDMMLEAGYVVVSIDYRLAPETKLPSIIEDLEDAYAWVHARGPALFNADTNRIAVMGSSAGGYLTLTAGFRSEPRPTVLVSFWGFGDLVGDWYSPQSDYNQNNWGEITSEVANAQVSGPPISDARDRDGDGRLFSTYTRQKGNWPFEVSGWDPHTEVEKFYPFMPVKNVTSDYPPTMLVHGADDSGVPVEQARLMAAEFEEHGVAYELIEVPGAEHALWGGDPQLVDEAYEKALAWVDRYMR